MPKHCFVFVLIAGAGCSRDSGLPTFNEVPDYLKLCNPRALRETPEQFHEFFLGAKRRYESTAPHAGYAALRRLCERPRRDTFLVTSNVDRALQTAGLPEVVEIHGNAFLWQCAAPCCRDTFPAPEAASEAHCPACGGAARPNVLLFEDTAWLGGEQMAAVAAFAARTRRAMAADPALRLVCLEIGAADRVPTIRTLSEDLLAQLAASGAAFEDPRVEPVPRAHLVRVNPDPLLAGIVRESAKHLQPLLISLQTGAKDALLAIE